MGTSGRFGKYGDLKRKARLRKCRMIHQGRPAGREIFPCIVNPARPSGPRGEGVDKK